MLLRERAYKSPDVVRFLKHLLRHIPGTLLVLWDGSPIHRGQPVGVGSPGLRLSVAVDEDRGAGCTLRPCGGC
jgi:hypothetical protein